MTTAFCEAHLGRHTGEMPEEARQQHPVKQLASQVSIVLSLVGMTEVALR